jgi:hypothetical protein
LTDIYFPGNNMARIVSSPGADFCGTKKCPPGKGIAPSSKACMRQRY